MKKTQQRSKYFFIMVLTLSFGLLMLNSCYKDRLKLDRISGVKWNPKLAVPLFYGDLNMSKVVDNGSEIWKEYPDGLLSLIYRGDTISDYADQVITIQDQSSDTSIHFAFPPNFFPGDSTSKIFLIKAAFKSNTNQRVDSILIKSGQLILEVSCNINHSSYVEFIIPSLTRYGITFKEKVKLPYTGSTPTSVTRTINLQDYWLQVNKNGSISNQVNEYIKVMVKRGNGSDNSPYNINLKQTLKDITYYQVFGYFHQHTINLSNTNIPISIFDNLKYSQVFIEDPKLSLIFNNSYGMPVDVTFTDLYVEKDGNKKNITSSLLPTLPLNYPNFSNIGNSSPTVFTFDINNSNIKDIVNSNPKKLVYSGNAITNPTGNVIPEFIIDTAKIRLSAELEIPLHGRALSFILQDTTKINFEDLFDWKQLVSIDLNINTDNYFPNEANLQLYLGDSNKVIFDSIFIEKVKVISAGIPGPPPAYRVSTPAHNMTTIKLSNTKLDNLRKAKTLIVSARATTYDKGQKIIKIYSDYKISVELSAKGDYKTKF